VQWSRARPGEERSGSAGRVLTAVQHRKHPDGWYRQIPAAKLRSSGCAVPWARSVAHDSARADDDDDADAARRINTHSQEPNCSGAFTRLLAGIIMMTTCVCLWCACVYASAVVYLIRFLIQPVSLQHAQMREEGLRRVSSAHAQIQCSSSPKGFRISRVKIQQSRLINGWI